MGDLMLCILCPAPALGDEAEYGDICLDHAIEARREDEAERAREEMEDRYALYLEFGDEDYYPEP